MLLYVTLGSNDIVKSTKFYDAALAPLGMSRSYTAEDEIGYGAKKTHTRRSRKCTLDRPSLFETASKLGQRNDDRAECDDTKDRG